MIVAAILSLFVQSSPCDTQITALYQIHSQLVAIKACQCLSRGAIDDTYDAAHPVLKQAASCECLRAQVDSLTAEFKRLRKQAR